MRMKSRRVLQEALALSEDERAALVNDLIASLAPSDEAVDAVWCEEVSRRLASYRKGTAKTVSIEDVLAEASMTVRFLKIAQQEFDAATLPDTPVW